MESRLLSHSTAGPSTARDVLAGPAPYRPNARPLYGSRKTRQVQLQIIARATAPAKIHSNGVSSLLTLSVSVPVFSQKSMPSRPPLEKGLTGAGTQVSRKQQRRKKLHRKRQQSQSSHGVRTGTLWQWQACWRGRSPTRLPSLAETMWCGTRMACGMQPRMSAHTGEQQYPSRCRQRNANHQQRLNCTHTDTCLIMPIQQSGLAMQLRVWAASSLPVL